MIKIASGHLWIIFGNAVVAALVYLACVGVHAMWTGSEPFPPLLILIGWGLMPVFKLISLRGSKQSPEAAPPMAGDAV